MGISKGQKKGAAHSHDNIKKRRKHPYHKAKTHEGGHSVLRDNVPRAGMIYPFAQILLRRQRTDIAVTTAICKGLGVPRINPSIVDTVFSQIFEEATKLAGEIPIDRTNADPIEFMRSLRARPDVRGIWIRRYIDTFATLFLILRCARLNWLKNPRPPLNIAEHGKTARAIDSFLAVENLNWSGVDGLGWLVTGGIDIIKPDSRHNDNDNDNEMKKEEEMDAENDEDSLFVEQTAALALDAEESTHAGPSLPRRFDLSLEDIVQGMRRLCIDVDQTALTAAFAKLQIREEEDAAAAAAPAAAPAAVTGLVGVARPAAPPKDANPFVDDEENYVDDVL